MNSYTYQSHFDIRTRLLAIILINATILSIGSYTVLIIWMIVLGLIALLEHKNNLWYFLLFISLLIVINHIPLPHNTMWSFFSGGIRYLEPYILASSYAYYLYLSTTPNELIAGLSSLKVPIMIIIPLAVLLRFTPTVRYELKTIFDSLRLRGLLSSQQIILHLPRTMEYILIPLLRSALSASEDLGAAAMLRGLGSPGRTTSIAQLKYTYKDALFLTVLGLLIFGLIYTRF